MPARALYDLIATQWLLPPISGAAEEVPLASISRFHISEWFN